MSTPVLVDARQTVNAPVRKPRRFGLFSVVTPITGGDTHWLYGGLTADGEECAQPEVGEIACGPSANKTSRSWYSDLEGDPWLAYMYETCKTVGRVSEAADKLRARFLAAEQSAVEQGFVSNMLATSGGVSVGGGDVLTTVGALERVAAEQYGGQITLYLTAEQATALGTYLIRVGDHLETLSGSLVAVGNFDYILGEGGPSAIFASGAVSLYRTDLTVTGPAMGWNHPTGEPFGYTNDYFVLAERAYAAIVDCWVGQGEVGATP